MIFGLTLLFIHNAHVIGLPLGGDPGQGRGLCQNRRAMYINFPVHEGNDSSQFQNISPAFSEKLYQNLGISPSQQSHLSL